MKPIKLPQFRKTAQVTLAIALLNAASVDAVWANLTTETIAFDITDQSVIKGIVKDQDGKPIDGGTIINESSKQSTRTEFNGNFNLQGQTGDQVRILSLGYKTVTITATDNLQGVRQLVEVDCGKSKGWYDIKITSASDPQLKLRYAGHIETGLSSYTDPLMGRV